MAAAVRTRVRRMRRRLVRGTITLLEDREDTWSFDTAESETYTSTSVYVKDFNNFASDITQPTF